MDNASAATDPLSSPLQNFYGNSFHFGRYSIQERTDDKTCPLTFWPPLPKKDHQMGRLHLGLFWHHWAWLQITAHAHDNQISVTGTRLQGAFFAIVLK